MVRTQVRVKRWGKSPPRRQQWRRQGKPRAVQDQIGGESRPGSMSAFELEALPRGRRKPNARMNPRVGRSILAARLGLEE